MSATAWQRSLRCVRCVGWKPRLRPKLHYVELSWTCVYNMLYNKSVNGSIVYSRANPQQDYDTHHTYTLKTEALQQYPTTSGHAKACCTTCCRTDRQQIAAVECRPKRRIVRVTKTFADRFNAGKHRRRGTVFRTRSRSARGQTYIRCSVA